MCFKHIPIVYPTTGKRDMVVKPGRLNVYRDLIDIIRER